MKQITDEQIREAADKETLDTKVELISAFNRGYIAGAKWMQEQLTQWTVVDLEDEDTLPNDFEPVLCWTKDDNLQMLMMMKYGAGVDCYEWETHGLNKNQAFPIEHVIKWVFLEDPS